MDQTESAVKIETVEERMKRKFKAYGKEKNPLLLHSTCYSTPPATPVRQNKRTWTISGSINSSIFLITKFYCD